jgi:hypothetical protein
VGVVGLMHQCSQTHHPPPQPSPTRGEGADRVCRALIPVQRGPNSARGSPPCFRFTCQTAQSSSFPRRVAASGFVLAFRADPDEERRLSAFRFVPDPRARGGRSAGRRTYLVLVALAKRDNRAGETRAVPRNRDGAFRRSTVAIFEPRDHASRLRQCRRSMPRLPAARALKAQAVRVPRPPGRGRTAVPGRHTPLRLQTSPETPLMSEDESQASMNAICSQYL